ncbi:hypothetical protein Ahy_A07g037004 [Arachis hypogaea]|uniref:Uncharacterized protein n=1 Tax=Arachis hypogaea TaxID=3818 RepID=A0A445CHL2_ARAHY|nr:hypothetical protein Ahy_A07g037004 [Arachis hypogaea]
MQGCSNWVPIWTGDEDYEKFEVHRHPTNMVVNLGKRLCTCQHSLCSCLCYSCTGEEETRGFLSSLGQSLWKKSVYNQPQAANIKRKPGKQKEERMLTRRTDEVAATLVAATAAIAAAKSKITPTVSTLAVEASNTTNEAPQVVEAPPGVGIQNLPHVDVTNNFPPPVATAEIDLSQPNYNGT